MKVISLKSDISINLVGDKQSTLLKKNEFYVLTEGAVQELMLVYGVGLVNEEVLLDHYLKPYNGEDLNDKSLFCFRSAGLGDLMAIMTALRLVKEKYPRVKIFIGSSPEFKQLFEDDPIIDSFVPFPYPLKFVQYSDYTVMFQGLVETLSEESTTKNFYDLYIDAFKLDSQSIPREKKVPRVCIQDEIQTEINLVSNIPHLPPFVGIQLESSTIIRNYPAELMKQVIDGLNAIGIPTIIIGDPISGGNLVKKYKLCDELISFDFTKHCKSLQHLFAIIQFCDFIIGPDTSGMHIAGALEKTMIGLFGPIPSKLRIGYFNNAIGMDGMTRCAPCFLHGNTSCRQSVIEGFSPCLLTITPKNILDVVKEEVLPLLGINQFKRPKVEAVRPIVDDKRALVTLAIGADANKMVDIALPSLEHYAHKTGADLVIISEPKINGYSPHFEKFQMAELLDKYDRIVYVDADTLIHPACPDLFNLVPVDHVGVVPDSQDGQWHNLNRINEIMNSQQVLGFVNWGSGYFNSGVMVFSKEHKGLFDEPENRTRIQSTFLDQTILNYNFQKHGYKLFRLNPIFNGMEINGFSSRVSMEHKARAMIMHLAHEGNVLEQMQKVSDYIANGK
jgi:ADP-heptose:LPS heptosyltransferase